VGKIGHWMGMLGGGHSSESDCHMHFCCENLIEYLKSG
jgi:hypothetical protein